MYALAVRFRQLGANGLSLLCAARLLDLAPLDLRAGAPAYVVELSYPTYFPDLVQEEAETNSLDALLLYAIIRQESLFEPSALSYAGARGLMQVIPATGDWVAEQVGWPDYGADDLYRPYISVKFGAFYLSAALQYGGGNLMTALVGYNAGPGNARFWRQISGDDDDLYLEIITNSQPQRYVRGVLRQYGVYQQLYGVGGESA
jgi:soluble lytic murein transglycosylase